MKMAGAVAASLIAPLLFWQAAGQVLPAVVPQSPAWAAQTSSVEPSIQSVAVQRTAASAGNETEAPPAYVPSDSYFARQWALEKVQTWQIASVSSDILVAIVDTGIDQQHEDLVGKVIGGINLTDSPTDSDILGHGTHVSGIIVATTDNGIGIAGVAPNSRLLNVKAADDSGRVWPSTVAEGIIWAVDNGASIINMSVLVPSPSSALEEAVDYAWSRGVVLVAAAGNDSNSIPVYPACYPRVIGVAATDIDGSLWVGSNYGDWVGVCAPGVEIYSTLPGNAYGYRSGTSMATAHVAAMAALAFTAVTDANGDGFLNDEVTARLKAVFGHPQSRLASGPKS